MQIVPAHCSHCGLIFLMNFGFVQTLTLNNVRVGCPHCKNYAQTVDGTFDFIGNAIRASNAPPRTIAILQILQSALAAAQSGEPDAKVLDKIKDASPNWPRKSRRLRYPAACLSLVCCCYCWPVAARPRRTRP
jgi:hypothetical protein